METTTVTFQAQAWVNDETVFVDAEGPTQWEVPTSKLKNIEPRTYEADQLRDEPNAPQWCKDWSGPYFIYWEI